jgi:hypothetical protein
VIPAVTFTITQNLEVIKLYEMGHYNEDHYIFQILQSSFLRKLSIKNFPDQAPKAPHVCGTERKTNNKHFIS